MTRRTRKASRTCRGGCRISRRSRSLVGYEPTVDLDEILTRVDRILPAAITNVFIEDPNTRAPRPSKGVLRQQRQAGAAAAAGHWTRPRADAARDRPDREHQHLQREMRVLPARRDAPPAGGHVASICSRRSSTSAPSSASPTCACTTTASRSSTGSSSRRCATPRQKGIQEVGMISNGSLITEEVARGMIEAGLDAINISVDAAGKRGFRVDAHRLEVRQGHRQHRAARAAACGARTTAAEADSVVRASEQLGRRAGVHRTLESDRRQDSHHRPAQLGGDAQPRIGRQLSLLPARG